MEQNVVSDSITGFKYAPNLKDDYEGLRQVNGPMMVSLDVTSRCNLSCIHCLNDSSNRGNSVYEEMNDRDILMVVDQIIELNPHTVCICGGEPLLRKNLFDIIDKFSQKGIFVSMVSNGFLIDSECVNKLKKCGLKFIQISLDGVNKKQHDYFRGVQGSFDRAVSAIKLLVKAGFNVAVSFVPNKLNHKDFYEYVDFVNKLGVISVRVMPFLPLGRGNKFGKLLMLNEEEYFYFQRKIFRCAEIYRGKMDVEWGDPLDHYIRMKNNYKAGLKTYCVEIRANGDIFFSTYMPIKIGNCLKKSLKEYWLNGLDNVWGNPTVIQWVNKVKNIYDFEKLDPQPYFDTPIEIKLDNGGRI
ncbi:radical SAM protein [Caloranaerobacter azorensis]|uniref:Radical SAM protein n=1 Tax=Caloranaerobacter azorensis TaxID=116090 RepID=A0A6P1YGN1_9FIRM|nr:radical SAM protein [Caloranaerobacter azorensis]QIB27355.1 radical SAM protein [Caloranaerobacter azorensis]